MAPRMSNGPVLYGAASHGRTKAPTAAGEMVSQVRIPSPGESLEQGDALAPEPATTNSAPSTLREARAVIPPHCYERANTRAWLTVAQATGLYVAPMVALVLVDTWWTLPVLWALAGLGIAGLFVLGHDASHGALFTSPRVNRWVALACMVPSVHVEAAWDLGHNRIHHGYTARQGFDFVWHPSTVDDYRALTWWQRARHRVEWSPLGSGLYYLRAVWWEKMIWFPGTERRRAEIRSQKKILGFTVALLMMAAAVLGWADDGWIGAVWLPVKLVVIPFLVFIHIIGWTVYVHHVSPDMRWWTRRDWTQAHGQLESTTILQMPAMVNRLWFHNIFVHVPHHLDVRIPFHHLPAAADALLAAYPGTVRQSRFKLRDYLRSSRACKLYDFGAGAWRPYPPRRPRSAVNTQDPAPRQ